MLNHRIQCIAARSWVAILTGVRAHLPIGGASHVNGVVNPVCESNMKTSKIVNRGYLIFRKILLALIFATCGLLLYGCGSQDEVARESSPSGLVDAVLVETNGGATTSFGYIVYLVSPGKSYKQGEAVVSLYGAIRNRHTYGVNLKWSKPNHLTIEYLSAQDAEVLQGTTTIADEEFTLELRPGIEDPAAPPGGMLYNLRKGKR